VKPAARRWRRLRRWLLTAIACVLISAAALMALGRLLVPWLVDSPDRVAAWLSDRIGLPVQLDSVSASWEGPGPMLNLAGLRVFGAGADEAAISLGRARVQVDVYALLLPDRHLIRDFLLVDAQVELSRDRDGRIVLQGLNLPATESGGLASWLGRVGNVGLTNGGLRLTDQQSGRSFELDQVELRLSQTGRQLRLGLERPSHDGGGHLRAVLESQGPLHWPAADGQFYVEARQFPLAELAPVSESLGIALRDGVLDGRQWFAWSDGHLRSTEGDWNVGALVMTAPAFEWLDVGSVEPNLHLPVGRLVLDGAGDAAAFELNLRCGAGAAAEQLTTDLSLRRTADGSWSAAASGVPVAALAALGQLTQQLPPTLRSRLYAAQPGGTVNRLTGNWDGDHWQLHADLEHLQISQAAPHWPQFKELSGSISADAQGLVFTVSNAPVEFAVPGVFREPIALSTLDLLVGVSHDQHGWVAEVPTAHLQGAGFSADLRLRLDNNAEGQPQLQAVAHVPGADIEAAKAFWTINKMPPRAIEWLDTALGKGRVTDGKVVFRGPLPEWPFKAEQGRFEARFAVADANLDYHRDWPRAEHLAAEGAFINDSLVIDSAAGTLLGNRVVSGHGNIASLKDPILELHLQGQGDAAGWLQFLKSSPMQRTHGAVLFGMDMAGAVDIGSHISIPLRHDLGATKLTGQVQLHGVQFRDTKWNLAFTDVEGAADFSHEGFAASGLNLKSEGLPAQLSLAVGAFSTDPDLQLQADLKGRLSAQALFGQYDQLATVLAQISGLADWDVELKVPRATADGVKGSSHLRYRTALQGTAIGFPRPLGKPAESILPLVLAVELPADDASAPLLRLDIGDDARLFAQVGTRSSEFRGQLQLGAEQSQDLPSRGLRVTGHAMDVDLAGWASWILAGSAASAEDSLLSDIDLSLGAAQDHLQFDRSEGPWTLRVKGPSAEGFVRFETSADRPSAVVAQFEHLFLPEPEDGAADLVLTPAMVPTLHLWVRDLRIGEARLGEARLEAFASDDGLRVDLLEARSPDLEIHASGDWRATSAGAESRFKIRMVSEDLGRMLTGLGFAGVIAGGQTLAQIDAHWRGAPFAFALERLTGSIDVSVGQGRFLDVDPGAGRIFGLLSLRELPRRLTLDFRDLFQSGMSFDRIEGRFQLADGNAWTENLTVRGPAADILIIGRTGLASRDYDQQVMVAPRMSGVLPVLGGLAAGPVGAAAGLLAQGMVQQGDIEKSSRVHYSIAGSWEKPVVARLTPVRPDAPPRRRIPETEGGAG
jgi:uncharacterized protein (TIGR02099 family)